MLRLAKCKTRFTIRGKLIPKRTQKEHNAPVTIMQKKSSGWWLYHESVFVMLMLYYLCLLIYLPLFLPLFIIALGSIGIPNDVGTSLGMLLAHYSSFMLVYLRIMPVLVSIRALQHLSALLELSGDLTFKSKLKRVSLIFGTSEMEFYGILLEKFALS